MRVYTVYTHVFFQNVYNLYSLYSLYNCATTSPWWRKSMINKGFLNRNIQFIQHIRKKVLKRILRRITVYNCPAYRRLVRP